MTQQLEVSNGMKKISIEKVVVNIAVGKSGEPLERAKRALKELTGQSPSVRGAKKNFRDFGIHKGEPIGSDCDSKKRSCRAIFEGDNCR